MLSKEEIEKYKTQLEQEKRRILMEIEKAEPQDFGGDVESDLSEESDEAEDMNDQLAVQASLKETLSEVDLALARIQKGTYGKCEKCGADIETKVLDLVPESALCENCKLEI